MSDTPSTFDPGRYLRKLQGADYLDVKWRVVWVRTDHPDAVIATEAHMITDQLAVFRAAVTLPSGAHATGWGSEQPKDFRDYIEKAETKAIGRALSALGYGTQFATDHEDGASTGRPADAPVQRPAAAQAAPPPAEDESPEDRRKRATAAVFAAGSDKRLESDDVKAIAYHLYETDSMTKVPLDKLRDYWHLLNKEDADTLAEMARIAHEHAAERKRNPDNDAPADAVSELLSRAP